jgi:hypothetical protein
VDAPVPTQRRRRDIFVEPRFQKRSSSVGAVSSDHAPRGGLARGKAASRCACRCRYIRFQIYLSLLTSAATCLLGANGSGDETSTPPAVGRPDQVPR